MLFRYRRLAQQLWFGWGVRSLHRTPPLRRDPAARVQAVTQLHPPDVAMYLVAIKTFARFVPLRDVWVVGERLEDRHKEMLRRHVEGVRIVDVREIDAVGFPTGGCWERLLHIIDLSRDLYTIQIDADTITLAPPHEVISCIRTNRSFTLGTTMGRQVVAASDMPRLLGPVGAKHHVQVAAELAFPTLDRGARYIRGNAAFAGFAAGAASRDFLKRFSDAMQAALGTRWREWGSEQVSSNFVIGNTVDPLVLPLERYSCFTPATDLATKAFLHFIGTHRFAGGVYRRLSQEVVDELAAVSAGGPPPGPWDGGETEPSGPRREGVAR